METLTFHFHKNNRIYSKLVQWKTGSHLSHVSIELKGFFYNAYADKRFYKTKEKSSDVIESYSLQITDKQYKQIDRILNASINRLYDYKAIFGFLLNIKMDSNRRTFCSEIANQCLDTVIPGKVKFEKLVSPGDIRIAVVYYLKGLEKKSKNLT